eukprot:768596-Hanusia_phi.AAC.2
MPPQRRDANESRAHAPSSVTLPALQPQDDAPVLRSGHKSCSVLPPPHTMDHARMSSQPLLHGRTVRPAEAPAKDLPGESGAGNPEAADAASREAERAEDRLLRAADGLPDGSGPEVQDLKDVVSQTHSD